MKKISRKKGDFTDLTFEINLTDMGKTDADIADIFFSVKNTESDADDLLLLKKKTAGQITNGVGSIINVAVQWPITDYVNFQIDKEYLAGLFIKFTGDPTADEHVDQIFHITIKDDLLKQN